VAGVNASETTVAGRTASDALALRPPDVATMVVVPCVLPVASPAAVMVAMAGVVAVKVEAAVISRVVLLPKLPMMVYCSVLPIFTLNVAG
jgi:hypothetical protein